MDNEKRLIDLETRLAHQDQTLLELGDEIYRQQRQIAMLEDRCRQLLERLDSIGAANQAGGPTDDVPPHY